MLIFNRMMCLWFIPQWVMFQIRATFINCFLLACLLYGHLASINAAILNTEDPIMSYSYVWKCNQWVHEKYKATFHKCWPEKVLINLVPVVIHWPLSCLYKLWTWLIMIVHTTIPSVLLPQTCIDLYFLSFPFFCFESLEKSEENPVWYFISWEYWWCNHTEFVLCFFSSVSSLL